jgi:phosphate-selective porin OprO/OprP
MKLAWSAVIALGMAGLAWADEGDESTSIPARRALDEEGFNDLLERVRKIEEAQQDQELEKLKAAAAREKQEEMEGLPARVSKLEKAQAPTTYDASKMLTFATADGNFTAKIGGRIYFNYRHTFDRDDSTGNAVDTFWVDTARMQLEGTFLKDFYYRVEAEMKSGENTFSSSSRAGLRMKDTYIAWTAVPDLLILQAGQFKTPWSQEETCSSRFIDFVERSLLNRIAPAHDVGFVFRGSLAGKIIEWNLGVMNGALNRDDGRGAVDSTANDEKDVVGRIFLTPFLTSTGMKFFQQTRIGFDFTMGDRDNQALGGGFSDGDVVSIAVNPFAPTAGVNADGIQQRMLFNFSWLYGPASFRAEYAIVNTELSDVPGAASDFDVTAWYVQATFLLTGEAKPLENRVKPNSNLSLSNGTWGAFELAVRIANLDTSDGEYEAGIGVVAPTANQQTREVAFGINWWWSQNVALRLNYEMFTFDEDLTIATGSEPDDKLNVFMLRWQIDF